MLTYLVGWCCHLFPEGRKACETIHGADHRKNVLEDYSGVPVPQHSAPKVPEAGRRFSGVAGTRGAFASRRGWGWAWHMVAGPGLPAFPPPPGATGPCWAGSQPDSEGAAEPLLLPERNSNTSEMIGEEKDWVSSLKNVTYKTVTKNKIKAYLKGSSMRVGGLGMSQNRSSAT